MTKGNDFPDDHHEEVSISRLRPGDTVLVNGEGRTVGRADLGHDELLGPTFRGDSYRAGRDKITRITFGAEIARREAAMERSRIESGIEGSEKDIDKDSETGFEP